MNKENIKISAAFIAVCVIWGSTYLAIRIGVSDLPPELFMGIRFVIAGGIMIGITLIRKRNFPVAKDVLKISVVGLFLLTGANGLVAYAEQWVHSGITALILAILPLFIACIELFIPGRSRLDYKGWIGLLAGFGGVAVLVLSGSNIDSINISGAIMLVAAALLWAIGSVYSKSFSPSGSITSQIGIQMLAGGLFQCVNGILLGEVARFHFTAKGFGAFLYLIMVGSLLGYSSYIYVLKNWSAAKAGTFAYVNPIVAVFLGAVVLSEQITLMIILASILILGGVFLVQISKSRYKAGNDSIISE
ncbi:MAG: EamA family transporter [Spirochaetota bacterium]